jgi:D-3-phosphoglycerate dehydrogenase
MFRKGIVVFNSPGANANGVKELVIAGLLMASRNVAGAVEWANSLKDKGEEIPKLVEKGKSNFAGPEIKGKTLGVIGLGAIGVLVANAAESLGMNVLGYDPFISVDAAWGLNSSIHKASSVDEIYTQADYITVHVPLMEKTKNMISKDEISMMKDGVRILNFARGGLIDNKAIKDALEEGKVAKYITDFPSEETIDMKNTVNIPHLGASTPESETNCALMAVGEIIEFIENGNIINSVNYPNCDMGKCSTDLRIAVNHKNIPNMVSQITNVFSKKNANIANMLNKSKNDWAYTLLDVEGSVEEGFVKELENIDGVVKVRIIK